MQIDSGLDTLKRLRQNSVLSIGNFDGVHVGHQKILSTARQLADKLKSELVVMTFEPHPTTVLRPELAPPRLSALELKRELLAALRVDRLIELAPTREVLSLEAAEFYRHLKDARIAHLVEGNDFNFGKARGGNIMLLKEWCRHDSISLDVVEHAQVMLGSSSVSVSSSLIRSLLTGGDVSAARTCLGRPFRMISNVIHGDERGRTLGYPTANLDPADQVVPDHGVYFGATMLDDKKYRVAISIGSKPTFDGIETTVEAYVLDFKGDLYDKPFQLDFIDRIRGQEKFDGVESLKKAIARDVEQVRDATLN
ncbi:MAG TPA: bifunctional riboflavin kinase/FAD synthetase [Tepidisphaeraceae bacterium]|nr:bifunctional riboflavin kinase/FAD synthetase [Tepidisphaeraceae bacterium]